MTTPSPSGRARAKKTRERRWQDVPVTSLRAHDGFAFLSFFRYDLPILSQFLRNFDTPAARSNAFGSVIYSLGGRMRGDFVASYKDLSTPSRAHRKPRYCTLFCNSRPIAKDVETLARDGLWQKMSKTEAYPPPFLAADKAKITRGNDARRALERYWGQFLQEMRS